MNEHIKTHYTNPGEPRNRTKAHVGNRIEFVSENGYKIPEGSKGTIDKMTLSINVNVNCKDWFYRVILDSGKSVWVMAAGSWKVNQ